MIVGNVLIFVGASVGFPMGLFLAWLGFQRKTIGLGVCGTAIAILSLITMIYTWAEL